MVAGASLVATATAAFASPTSSSSDDPAPTKSKTKTQHWIILVHGWMGNDLELGYLESSLNQRAAELLTNQKEEKREEEIVVYSSKINVGKTHDGIAAGGTRLAQEIQQLIHAQPTTTTTLSFVGNSMGGLYARHAISQLEEYWNHTYPNHNKTTSCPSSPTVHPLVFVTTATPHLGVSQHTYIPLPRVGEWVVANVIQDTGRDLFRFTSILEELAHDPMYKRPLQAFRKRVAYANAFATDFQVPTATAAFLSTTSTARHVTLDNNKESSFIVLEVETVPDPLYSGNDVAQALDALGWTKIFCDNRDNIPLPGIPTLLFGSTEKDDFSKLEWTSDQLLQRLTGIPATWKFPLGHTVLVANSKSDFYSYVNRKGQPVMDRLARTLLHDIVRLSANLTNHEEQGGTNN